MLREVIAPCAAIALLSAGLGLGVNAVRDRDRIEIGRAYFAPTAVPPDARTTGERTPDAGTDPEPGPRSDTAARTPAGEDLAARAAREFAVIDDDRARTLLDTARREPQHLVFVDARDDAHFRAGHVPGALQVDYYNVNGDIEPVLPALRMVPWLVIYCESADCEDGLLLCRSLRDSFGIPSERMMLYVAGMRGWRARGFPVTVVEDWR